MQAVYELSTVKPHLPKRRRYTLAELAIYSDGYYQALAMALQVMTLAFRRQESRIMREQQPTPINSKRATPGADAAADPEVEGRTWLVFNIIVVVGVIAGIEVLVLGALLILRLLP